ncbi:MAG: hypothetical protein EPO21_10885 [Chloroflexota bacterium]|nr:MAG: hypothetical protein EPO21_10885 [Chloroflexota bacterium]
MKWAESSKGPGRSRSAAQRRTERRVLLMVIATELIVVVAMLGAFVAWPRIAPGSIAGSAPQQIAGRTVSGVVTGDQAIAQLRQMHGKGVGIQGGWIAHYDGGATIWYGTTSSEAEARALIESMTNRISQGNPTFQDLQTLTIQGTTIYTVTGQGQRHFYYYKGPVTVWIAAPRGAEEQFVREALTLVN